MPAPSLPVSAHYLGSCVTLDGDAIGVMVDEAQEITRRVFVGCVGRDKVRSFERALGYPLGGLTMARDWHVRYYRGRYRERPCWFVVHSAIEYVWVLD